MSLLADRVSRMVGPRTETFTRRDEWAVALFGTWTIAGLFLDGWAHGADKPETFFSPWHGVLYSGFTAAMVFMGIESYRARSRGDAVRLDPLMLTGIVLFVASGVGDMLWHEAFGIEVGIEALLNPTHLMLMIGGLLIMSGPFRSGWSSNEERAGSMRSFFPILASLALITALMSFFTMYASPFLREVVSPSATDEAAIAHAVGSILLTNALLLVAMLLVLRRWTPPAGTFTILFGAVSFGMVGLDAFARIALVVPALIGGASADAMVSKLRPSTHRTGSVRVIAAVVPAVLWSAWFATFALAYGLPWTVELWTGTIVLSVLSGVGLSFATFAPRLPQLEPNERAVS